MGMFRIVLTSSFRLPFHIFYFSLYVSLHLCFPYDPFEFISTYFPSHLSLPLPLFLSLSLSSSQSVTHAAAWGYEVPPFRPDLIKSTILEYSSKFSHYFGDALGGVVGVISDSLRFLVSCFTFFSLLFFFLKQHVGLVALHRLNCRSS